MLERNERGGELLLIDPSVLSAFDSRITLPQLIQLTLAARRYYDFGDVVFLIRVHDLDESFMAQLHPAVRQDFIECLEEKRREDVYDARED